MPDQKVVIKSFISGSVLFETTARDLRDATEQAVRSGAYLSGADLREAYLSEAYLSEAYLRGADLRGADLREAYLSGADLSGADLREAYLSGAYLSGADLREAYLSGAYLSGADLREADLSGAEGIDPWHVTPLLMLLDQPGPIRAYKMTNAKGEGPYNGGIVYEVGGSYEVDNANTDVTADCGAGINLATWDWIAREWQPGYRVFVAEFTAEDIASIPTATDGKFRCHRVRIVSEVTDLASRGLGTPEPAEVEA